MLDLLRVISHHRARLATPLRTYQKVYGESDVETVPFAQTRAAANRHLLLIEPSYKVSNEDKTRTPPASSVQPNEEKDVTTTTTSEQTLVQEDNKVDKISSGLNSDDRGKPNVVTATESTAVLKDLESEEADKSPASPAKLDSERHISSPSKTILEENIVLGVALEGSKRTLPIDDEEMVPPPLAPAAEAKELAVVGKDKEEGTGDVPNPLPSSDQREKGR